MNKEPMPLEFESAVERTNFFRKNADYYTITWKENSRYHRFEFSDLETARMNAVLAATALQRTVMIYAVYEPYDSWIENVKYDINQFKAYIPKIKQSLLRLKAQGKI